MLVAGREACGGRTAAAAAVAVAALPAHCRFHIYRAREFCSQSLRDARAEAAYWSYNFRLAGSLNVSYLFDDNTQFQYCCRHDVLYYSGQTRGMRGRGKRTLG